MPRQSKDRVRVNFWVARTGDERIRAEAKRRGVTVSDLYRDLLRIGMTHYLKGER